MKTQKSLVPKSPFPSLTQYLAQAGVDSRRKVVDLVREGAVTVNGTPVYEPGTRVMPTDKVAVSGETVKTDHKVYILLNKPKDYITTVADEVGRKTVMDLIKGESMPRLYPIGRLDRKTTGLLLLTNDGSLAQKLSHPRHQVAKSYVVTLHKALSFQDFNTIKKGVELEDGLIEVDYIGYLEKKSMVLVEIHSGRNRIIRRLFEHFGYELIKLDRVGYAGLSKKGLLCGKWRHLSAQEIVDLNSLDKKKKQ
jgi:23S rRNA pseudouridine2605 synthase